MTATPVDRIANPVSQQRHWRPSPCGAAPCYVASTATCACHS